MGTLYLVRHGQASFGAADYDQLSPMGEQQSVRLGEYFKHKGLVFDHVLSGTLRRHQQTLASINRGMDTELAALAWPGLNEYDSHALIESIHPEPLAKPGAPVIRDDLAGKTEGAHGKRDHHNHIFTWDAGDKSAADAAFEKAEVTVSQHMYYPRVHPCPLETCGCVASYDPVRGDLTTFITSQAPHVVRTVVSMLSGIPESKVRIVSPDIGGGFGNKVGIYPGYVCAIVASIVLGRPV
eukprot:gene17263-35647_t